MQIKNADELHAVASGTHISFTDAEGIEYEGAFDSRVLGPDPSHFTVRLTGGDRQRHEIRVHALTPVTIDA